MHPQSLLTTLIELKKHNLDDALRFDVEAFIAEEFGKSIEDKLTPDEVAAIYRHFISKKY